MTGRTGSRRRTTCGCGRGQAGPWRRARTYRVRWMVAGKEWHDSFTTRALADSFRADLLSVRAAGRAVRGRHRAAGVVAASGGVGQRAGTTHACAYVDMKWPHAAGKSRQGIAESLATVTPALFIDGQEPAECGDRSATALRLVVQRAGAGGRPAGGRVAASAAVGGGEHPAGAGSRRPGGACGRRWTRWHCGWTAGRRRHRR